MNTHARLVLTFTAATLSLASTIALHAVAYTRTTGGNWSDATLWTPTGGPPGADDTATFTLGNASASLTLDSTGATTIKDFHVGSTTGGYTFTFTSPGSGSTGHRSINITGTLSKANDTTKIVFENSASSTRLLNVSIGKLDLATNGGSAAFGRADGTRALNNLTIGETILGGGGGSNSVALFLNVSNDYSLGKLTFNTGNNAKTVYLVSNTATAAGYARTATVNGITDTSSNATIQGSARDTSSDTKNAATLRIETTNTEDTFTAATALIDGTGGTLALRKTGSGTQTLTGASTYTGGTEIEQGTLVIRGPGTLAATGDLAIATGASFVTATEAALTLRNATLATGAILGFDLAAPGARLALTNNLTHDTAHSAGGNATFIIDFLGTGLLDHAYSGLLSVAGTTNDFASATLSYKNFGAQNLSGTLTFAQLANGFTITAGNIPEPALTALLGGLAILGLVTLARCRRINGK
ncbi:autotransporter-associated beta strand repeat-containing protein [Geminisphaera colitermitum]|uniref:autotransporter-associated beta strand repeat-containing protein n=1 Tax=Geminisphaera colitermitum TaxID=1148786 RepID=UPI000158C94E|nr:autotransporter-associated beta strand repeat-containing protein [Geminisphaera colitermitum]